MMQIMSKARKNSPSMPTEYFAEFGTDGSLTIHRVMRLECNKKGTTFKVGDTAEYDSYNLSYTGTITKITEKTVTIVQYPGSSMARKHMLSLHEFAWRNWDFNAEETARKNSEEMMYL